MNTIKPKVLAKDAVIGIIAPASGGSEQRAIAGIQWLKEQGFQVKLGASIMNSFGFLSQPDAIRVAELHQMFADPEVAAIVCLRGGYGSMRLLEQLDFELIKKNPKIFVGYSDITALHIAIHQRTGLVTFHGPMVASDMGPDFSAYSWKAFFHAVMSPTPLGTIPLPEHAPAPFCLYPGIAEGELVGGNLSLLAATLGTPYEIDTTDKLLFLEDVAEAPYRIDRMLTQLLLAGKLQTAAGIVLDVFAGCEKETATPDFSVLEVLQERLTPLSIPVLAGLYFGHTPDKATLPLGVKAKLDSEKGLLIITESATCLAS